MKALNFKISIELFNKIKELAKKENRSMTGQVSWMLNEFFIIHKMLDEEYDLVRKKSA
jgi:hypothetical protein